MFFETFPREKFEKRFFQRFSNLKFYILELFLSGKDSFSKIFWREKSSPDFEKSSKM